MLHYNTAGVLTLTARQNLFLVYAASYVKLIFTGTFVKVKISNRRITGLIILDTFWMVCRESFALDMEQGAKVYTIAENLKSGRHELLLFKRMDSCHIFTLYGFELEDGAEIVFAGAKAGAADGSVWRQSSPAVRSPEALEYVGKTGSGT